MNILSAPRLLLLVFAVAALMLPALVNGTIFMYPDSIGYFHAGESSLKMTDSLLSAPSDPGPAAAEKPSLNRQAKDGISTARSVYYGIPFVLLYSIGAEWALALAQTLIVVFALAASFRRLAIPLSLQPLALAGVLFAGLGLIATVAMPDVFAGLAVLALAMLLPHAPAMRRSERWLWLALLLACALTHKAILAIAAALLGVYVLWHALTDRRWSSFPAVLLALGVAFAGHSAVNIAVERLARQKPVETPFALARIVGDGTAERYLDSRCPEAGFRLCDYLDRFPMTENVFLWSNNPDQGIMHALPVGERKQISAEANDLVVAAIGAYPLHQAGASLHNLVAQFGRVGVTEYALGPRPTSNTSPQIASLVSRYQGSPAGRGDWPFTTLSLMMTVTYIGSLAILLGAFVVARQQRHAASNWHQQPQLEMIAWLLLGLLVNAAVSGVIGGVFDRYQGRVAWLMPLAAVAALAMVRRLREAPGPAVLAD